MCGVIHVQSPRREILAPKKRDCTGDEARLDCTGGTEGGNKVGIGNQYAPPLGSRLKLKLPPWTLGITWGVDQD